MKIYISADMEGISGISDPAATLNGHEDYMRMRRLQMGDVNAAISGAFSAGATEVVVNDSHNQMNNLMIEDLDPRAKLITGGGKPWSMTQGLDNSFDAAFLIGYHARSGISGVIDHTYTLATYDVKINGQYFGESEINAAVAGVYGVPVVMITGDTVLEEQVKQTVKPMQTVAVKTPQSRHSALCLAPSVAQMKINHGAQNALQSLDQAKPFVVDGPVRLEVTFLRSSMAKNASVMPGAELIGPRTTAYDAPDYLTAYRALLVFLRLA